MKYIAVKVKGINHWFWFLSETVTRSNGRFSGKNGWGLHGAFTCLDVSESEIVGEIHSKELQYN